jgi:type VI secretion system Hcp family effector
MRFKMVSRKIALTISFALSVMAPLLAHADIITLQITNVPGDAKFASNNGLPADSIRVLTVANSAVLSGCDTGSGICSGKVSFSNLSVVKKFGESSAPLFLLVATGRYVPEAKISFYRMKQGVPVKYYTIWLTEVLVVAQKWVGNSNGVDGADAENVELAYSRIALTDEETGTKVCYDVKAGRQC